MRRSCWLLALALGPLAVGAAHAEDAAARRLAKPISISFVEMPLRRAVREIGRLANVAVVVDEKSLGEKKSRFPVSLQLKRTPARQALDLLVKDAGIGYSIDGHVVFVSTRAKARAGELVIRSYDIRDLTYSVTNFPGPTFQLMAPAPATGFGPISLDEPPPESMVAAGSIGELVMSRIRPREWGAELGTSIEERGGRLAVVQTEEVHREIARFLEELRATEGIFVRIEVKGLLVDPVGLDEALEGTARPGFLRPDELRALERRLAGAGAERLGSARTICMNNQRVHAYTGTMSNYVSDVDISGLVYDPIVSQTFDGFIVDVRPVASHDRRFVTLTFRVEAPSLHGEPRSREVVTGSSRMSGATPGGGEWELEKDGDKVTISADPYEAGSPVPAPARVQELDMTGRHVMTNVQVPQGHAAYFTVPAVKGRAVLFIVRPSIVGEGAARR